MTQPLNIFQDHSLKNMPDESLACQPSSECPGEPLLKLLSGKWKPQIIRVAVNGSIRFNSLLRQLPGSNKQAIASALRELEEAAVLKKEVIQEKPLHIEYSLTERGKSILSIFKLASNIEIDHRHALSNNIVVL
jgi:DNA-binding HxlR family transcriptional regulator